MSFDLSPSLTKSIPYLSLSVLSGTLELGSVLFSIYLKMPLVFIIAMGLSYQLGSAVKDSVTLPPKLSFGLLILAAGMAYLAPRSEWLLLLATMLASVNLQSLRDQSYREGVSTTLKRVSRICGFLGAPLVQSYFSLLVLTALMAVSEFPVFMNAHNSWAIQITRPPALSRFGLTMLCHQMHYFSYCYLVPVLFFSLEIPLQYLGAAFVLGWLSYTFTPLKMIRNNLVAVVLGHIIIVGALACMFLSRDVEQLTLAWAASGLGGGAVVSLRLLGIDLGANEQSMDLWEGYGHVLGALLSVLVLGLTALAKSPLVLAIGFATLTIVLVSSTRR